MKLDTLVNHLVELAMWFETLFVPSQVYVDSREVAEMVGKQHKNLIRDIENYASVILQSSTLSPNDYFVESTYLGSNNRQTKHYLLTKKGCDMVANKMIGEVMSSRVVAEKLGREHKNVKRDLEQILIGLDLSTLIFKSDYKDSRGRTQEEYLLTKDGFTLYMFNIQS